MEIVSGVPYIDQVRQRLKEYVARLGRDLAFQDIDEELADPATKYAPPNGELLVAVEDGTVWGMVAYHRHTDARCEMKRLYVAPERRGDGLGERLVEAIIEHARAAGYKEMVLDTLRLMKSAIALYHRHGFTECAPYYDNPFKDVIYMHKTF